MTSSNDKKMEHLMHISFIEVITFFQKNPLKIKILKEKIKKVKFNYLSIKLHLIFKMNMVTLRMMNSMIYLVFIHPLI